MKRVFIFLLLFIQLSKVSLAQSDFREGYIIINDRDTIFGWIDYAIPTSNSKFCFFRENVTAEIEKFTPSDIHGFGFLNSNQFVSKQIPFNDDTLNVFLEYLVNGKIDLYYFLRNGRDYYYIEKNGEIYLLDNKEIEIVKKGGHYLAPNQKFTGRLKWILSDSNIPTSKIEKTAYTHNSLIKITQEYHYDVCVDEDCIVYYRPEKKVNDARWRINCGVSVGSSWTSLNMKSTTYREGNKFTLYSDNGLFFHTYRTTESNSNFNEISNSVLPGMFLNISRNRQISFQIEVQYQSLSYSYIEIKNVNIPLCINYDLLQHKKVIPYLNIGTFFSINIETSYNELYLNYDDVVGITFLGWTTVEDFLDFPKTNKYSEELSYTLEEADQQGINLLFGAGMKIQLTEKSILKFDLRYMNRAQKNFTSLINAPGAESTEIFKSINSILSFQYTIF